MYYVFRLSVMKPHNGTRI